MTKKRVILMLLLTMLICNTVIGCGSSDTSGLQGASDSEILTHTPVD
jgi:hypothetical protein